MEINSALNIVFPIRFHVVTQPDPKDAAKTVRVSEPLIWAYQIPLSAELFRANYRIIAKTQAEIWSGGLKYASTAGCRVANFTLLDISERESLERGTEDAGPALLADLKSLTYILSATPTGFVDLPVDVALKQGIIDADEWSEAEASIVFFTVGYAMSKRAARTNFCDLIASVLGGSMTSLRRSEYLQSLQQSTPIETSLPPAVESPAQATVPTSAEIPQ